jgi:hypothetical protein
MTFMKNDGDLKGCLIDMMVFLAGGLAVACIIYFFRDIYPPWVFTVYHRIFPRLGSPFLDALLPYLLSVFLVWAIHRIITFIMRKQKGRGLRSRPPASILPVSKYA